MPASVHDLLRAVLSYGREAPATALLLRCANDPQQLERWAAETPRQHYAVASLQPAVAQELLGRLESVETAMRAIAAEVAADRKAMLDLMGEIHHELRSAREDSITAQPAIVLDKIEDVGRSVSGLTERFEAIRTIGPGDAVAARLTALESKLAEQPSAIADAIAYMLNGRRAGTDEPLQLTAEDSAGSLTDKLASLEAIVRAQSERMDDAGKAHERDLNEISRRWSSSAPTSRRWRATWRPGVSTTAATSASSATAWRTWSARCRKRWRRPSARKRRRQWRTRRRQIQAVALRHRARAARDLARRCGRDPRVVP